MTAQEIKVYLNNLTSKGATIRALCMPQSWFMEWNKTPGTCKLNLEAAYFGTMFSIDAYEIGIPVLEVRYHLNGEYKLDRIL
jgi:hypothetical protein